jgi:hypothetical protein
MRVPNFSSNSDGALLLHVHMDLHVPMRQRQRSAEFRGRFTPMESDPSKELSSVTSAHNGRLFPASRHGVVA